MCMHVQPRKPKIICYSTLYFLIRQFKKFMKNANGKGFDKDRRQSSSSQFKSQDKGKKDARDGD